MDESNTHSAAHAPAAICEVVVPGAQPQSECEVQVVVQIPAVGQYPPGMAEQEDELLQASPTTAAACDPPDDWAPPEE